MRLSRSRQGRLFRAVLATAALAAVAVTATASTPGQGAAGSDQEARGFYEADRGEILVGCG